MLAKGENACGHDNGKVSGGSLSAGYGICEGERFQQESGHQDGSAGVLAEKKGRWPWRRRTECRGAGSQRLSLNYLYIISMKFLFFLIDNLIFFELYAKSFCGNIEGRGVDREPEASFEEI